MRKVTVLFIAADPLSAPFGRTPRLLLDEDVRHIRKKVRAAEYRDALEFDLRWVARADDLLHALNERRPQIVHFKGHGDIEGLLLVGADGDRHLVDPTALARTFELFGADVRVVFMSACLSLPQAQAVANVVGCVVGTPSGISEVAAITFDAEFYRAIAFGQSVQSAFDQASIALKLDKPEEHELPQLVVRSGVDPSKLVLVRSGGWPLVRRDPGMAATPGETRTAPANLPAEAGQSRSSTSMYSLIVTSEEDAWDRRRYGIALARFGEYTTEGVRARFITLDEAAIRALTTMPALLAYEHVLDQPARVARITRIILGSNDEVRFDFEPVPGIAPIPAKQLAKLRWELDITDREMNRTHWAIKEIDLMEVLREAGLFGGESASKQSPAGSDAGQISPTGQIPLAPDQSPIDLGASQVPYISSSVFAIPSARRDPRLVAVMMPFSMEFAETYRQIEQACAAVGLHAERADTIWEETTIIQEVFNLIYRSAVTIVDLTGRNPNVMYECGIAHTLGRPVVPIAQSREALPFDLAHHRILPYLPNAEGFAQMREKLERRLRLLTAMGS